MRRRDMVLGSGAVLMLAILGGCNKQLPTYRYRLTVEVDTPAGLRSGSSVIEVDTVDQGTGFPLGPEAGGIRSYLRGEGVAVDVAPGQTLFALLRSKDSEQWADGVMTAVGPAAVHFPDPGFQHRFNAMLSNRAPIILPRFYTKIPNQEK